MTQTPSHSKLDNATDEFLGEILPGWMRFASVERLKALRDAYSAHLQSQAAIASSLATLEPVDTFAKRKLAPAIARDMKIHVDFDIACWREERRTFKVEIDKLPTGDSFFVTVPLLQKLMQGFASGETFYDETALTNPEIKASNTPERILSKDSASLVRVCREVDVGAAYQAHLGKLLSSDFEKALAEDLRLTLAVQVEMAAIRGHVKGQAQQVLRDLAANQTVSVQKGYEVRTGSLRMLGCTLDGMFAVEIRSGWASTTVGLQGTTTVSDVLLVFPDDVATRVQHYPSWSKVNQKLIEIIRDPARRTLLERRVALSDRPGFLNTLAERMADDEPDLEPGLVALTGNLFEGLASRHIQRLKADAKFLAVPNADADAKRSSQRLALLESAGLTLLNLAGLFVPTIGTLLLANMVRETLSEVFTGVWHWSRGHQHEAIRHMLGVAENLAVTAAVAGGASLVARTFARSAFVDELEPVIDDQRRQHLWSNNLAHYQDASPPSGLTELDNGLLTDGQRHWWRHQGMHLRVRAHAEHGRWTLLDVSHEEAFAPELEWNGERAWRLAHQRPAELEWSDPRMLLDRLWPGAYEEGAERVAQMLAVADVDDAHLRGLLVENRPLPVTLRDTLERFAVEARVERFLADIGKLDQPLWDWCLDHLELQGKPLEEQTSGIAKRAASVRPRLFEHLAGAYLGSHPQLAILRRDFPGLPDAYALHVLSLTTVEQRVTMRTAGRIPLAVAQQAREWLQVARLTRLREALYLRGSYRFGQDEMIFSLLRRHAEWPASVRLELRSGTVSGSLLSRLAAADEGAQATHVLIRQDGAYRLYDAAGGELPASVPGTFDLPGALLACLPQADRQRLGWVGSQAADKLRSDLQGWLPQGRSALLELLGSRDVGLPHNPIRRLPDGRVGYLLSGRDPFAHLGRSHLRARIRGLYPGFNEQEVETFLGVLLERPGSAYRNLILQEQEYRRLSRALGQWVERARSVDSQTTRRAAARELRRSWRLIGERIVDQHGESQGMRLSLAGMPLRSLPELPVGVDFSHVSELVLMNLGFEELPAGFLRCFAGLRWLNLSGNSLTRVPADLGRLPRLTNLNLARNQIQMSAAGITTLQSLTRLQALDLNFNPLGAISLQLRPLVRLRDLHVRGANLQTVPSGLHQCRLLEVADLRDNHIGAVPQALLDAPLALRQTIELDGNPLSITIRQRMAGLAVDEAAVQPAAIDIGVARTGWLALADATQRESSGGWWDDLRAEPGSDDFFALLAELTGSRDYRVIPADLGRRVWTMLEAMHGDTALCEELFTLAADPRTCVDSVASCLSALEVRLYIAQALRESEPVAARLTRLRVARQLFRLDQVERIARADVQARLAQGQDVDEVEVSLAYRTGLASELELPGQPRTMQFETIAGVTRAQLTAAATTVRRAEASDQLPRYVAQRSFWLEYLRQEEPTAFSDVEAPFWTRMERLSDNTESSEGTYLAQMNAIATERQEATDALALRLTREALGLPASPDVVEVPEGPGATTTQ
jgi:hypothetical protein